LFALPNTSPPKPGMLRVREPASMGIELEVWEMDAVNFAEFVAAIPPPLGIGTIELEDGELVKGFLVESYAVAVQAMDITRFGGWRAYVASLH
jgi:allophanate hydrolase